NEMLQVDGKKMSKSLGNFFTVRDLLEQGVPGEVIRFVMLSTHYRKPMDWTEEKSDQAKDTLKKWALFIQEVEASDDLDEDFVSALSNDLNTPQAISELHKMSKQGRYSDLKRSVEFLNISLPLPQAEKDVFANIAQGEEFGEQIQKLIRALLDARKIKDYATADKIRDGLKDAGVSLSYDKDGGVTYKRESNFDTSKLEALK
ncbi:MAG: class I tRNA ligase family protein, partial [Marinosulfonomonas sp.]|nr:class I tRNA ligase family protein [Marinosulfonomonas sp.]